jgi:hypothetical protein
VIQRERGEESMISTHSNSCLRFPLFVMMSSFRDGNYGTGFIPEQYPGGFKGAVHLFSLLLCVYYVLYMDVWMYVLLLLLRTFIFPIIIDIHVCFLYAYLYLYMPVCVCRCDPQP